VAEKLAALMVVESTGSEKTTLMTASIGASRTPASGLVAITVGRVVSPFGPTGSSFPQVIRARTGARMAAGRSQAAGLRLIAEPSYFYRPAILSDIYAIRQKPARATGFFGG
jgi:hypothetical protein